MGTGDPPCRVFISYSHHDNKEIVFQNQGWVTCFRNALQERLRALIGTDRDVTVWMDEKGLSGDLTEAIKRELSNSDYYLAVLSNGFLNSTWCPDELDYFVRERGLPNHNNIIVVQTYELEPARLPEVLRKVYRFEAWQGSMTDVSKPPMLYAPASDAFRTLVTQVAVTLNRQRQKPGEVPPPPVVPRGATTVLLPAVHSKLRDQQERLKSFLETEGVQVQLSRATVDSPTAVISESETERFAACFRQELEGCDIVALPVNANPGNLLQWRSQQTTCALLQGQLADEAGKTLLLCRDPEISRESFDKFIKSVYSTVALAQQYEHLLFSRALDSWDDFHQQILDWITANSKQVAPYVYFDYPSDEEAPDYEVIQDMFDFLSGNGVCWKRLKKTEDDADFLQEFKQNVRSALACFVVFGDIRNRKWVSGRLARMSQFTWDNDPPKPVCVIAAPPPGKDVEDRQSLLRIPGDARQKLSRQLPGVSWWNEHLRILDFQDGFVAEKFGDLLDQIGIKPA
jgi:hypothetical protein